MILKGEMSMLNVLHLEHLDVSEIVAELQKKRDEMPQFFMQSPVVIDCALLAENINEFDFATLKSSLINLNFIPVGVRNIPATMHAKLSDLGFAVMRESRKPTISVESQKTSNVTVATSCDENEIVTESASENSSVDSTGVEGEVTQIQPAKIMIKSLTIDKPVRSGQQIYAAESDMTVLAQTSAGSEIMADGSIHVYGALRGRVLAGAMGNESARIFCQSLQAELIAIAGRYQLLDESDTELKGKPAMIKLTGEKLVIEPLST